MRKLSLLLATLKEFHLRHGKDTSPFTVITRLAIWVLVYRGGVREYFTLNLFKPENKLKHVLTTRQFERFRKELSPPYYMCLLEDKLVFDRYIKSFGFPVANTLGRIDRGSIHWFSPYRIESIDKITVNSLHCYVKILTKWGGIDVHMLEVDNGKLFIDRNPSTVEDLKWLTSNGHYLLQETVVQHTVLQKLNPSCVNTLRIVTISDGHQIQYLSGIIRMGIGNSITDNITSGGIGCGIQDDGFLMKEGFDGTLRLDRHPDTGVCFDGFKIPWYEEAKLLARLMHQSFHCFFMIAWDIAITETGPLVIEANPIGDIIYVQHFFPHIKHTISSLADSYRKNKDAFIREFVLKDINR